MPRIPRLRALQTLNLGAGPVTSPARIQFASISTTAPARDLRSKLWKGEAPGPEDPYTQRPEPAEEPSSKLPDEARPARTYARNPSRPVLPPKRSEARSEEDLTHNDPTYTPATSFKELEVAPTLKNWWDQPGHMGDESRFAGFARTGRVVEREVVEVHLRRAVVEVLALQQAGKLSEWSTKKWAMGDAKAASHTSRLPISVAEDGTGSLTEDASAVIERLTAPEEEVSSARGISLEKANRMRKWDSSWQDMVLNDEEVKFAVSATSAAPTTVPAKSVVLNNTDTKQLRKRVYQLTGNLIPDAKLGPARTVKHLLAMASKQPKPKKLAKLLESREDITALSNVTVHGRRVTPIDKEKSVGRWKVIKEELEKRGLPVTGTGGLPGHKERDWMRQNM